MSLNHTVFLNEQIAFRVGGILDSVLYQGCQGNEINSCRRRILVDQKRKTTVVVDEFFRYPVDVVVNEGNNSSKVLIGVVDEKTIPQRFR